MWKYIECVAIYTRNIDESIKFYQSLGLKMNWDTYQDSDNRWRLVGMGFPSGETELVLKNNESLNFTEVEIRVEDVRKAYKELSENPNVEWIQEPFENALGGHVAVMKAPDGNVFVLVGK
ncbi:VOC family protein [Rossellomorea sp. RS05]|uniref:VOC family protein n=1 Tax=Rossellomorea sp. RS05 TaxID=3149166 RepID=UPI0032219623